MPGFDFSTRLPSSALMHNPKPLTSKRELAFMCVVCLGALIYLKLSLVAILSVIAVWAGMSLLIGLRFNPSWFKQNLPGWSRRL